MASKLVWNGDAVMTKLRKAEKGGLEATGDQVVNSAKGKVRRDTDRLYNSIQIQQGEAFSNGAGYVIEVGSDEEDVPYAAIQELGPADGRAYGFTPYMMPAMDEEAPKLAENIAKRF